MDPQHKNLSPKWKCCLCLQKKSAETPGLFGGFLDLETLPGKRLQFANLKMAIDIVDLPIKKMAIVSH